MDELLKAVIPAVIGLVGTLATVVIGYRQWKHQQDRKRNQEFQTKRRLVYENLWEMLENVHIELRTNPPSKGKFDNFVQEINAFILKNSLYIDKADAVLARQYLDAVFRVNELVVRSRDKRAQRRWYNTDALPSDTLSEHQELQAAWSTADKLRDQVVTRFQRILSGKHR